MTENFTPNAVYDTFNESTIRMVEKTIDTSYCVFVKKDIRKDQNFRLSGDLSNHILLYQAPTWFDMGVEGTKETHMKSPIEYQYPRIIQLCKTKDPQKINTVTPRAIEFDSIPILDEDAFELKSSSVIKVLNSGIYRFSANVGIYAVSKSDLIRGRIRINESKYLAYGNVLSKNEEDIKINTPLLLTRGDCIELVCDGINVANSVKTMCNHCWMTLEFIRRA